MNKNTKDEHGVFHKIPFYFICVVRILYSHFCSLAVRLFCMRIAHQMNGYVAFYECYVTVIVFVRVPKCS